MLSLHLLIVVVAATTSALPAARDKRDIVIRQCHDCSDVATGGGGGGSSLNDGALADDTGDGGAPQSSSGSRIIIQNCRGNCPDGSVSVVLHDDSGAVVSGSVRRKCDAFLFEHMNAAYEREAFRSAFVNRRFPEELIGVALCCVRGELCVSLIICNVENLQCKIYQLV